MERAKWPTEGLYMVKAKSLAILLILYSFSVSSGETKYITIGSDAVHSSEKESLLGAIFKSNNPDITVVELDSSNVEKLSHHMHEEFHRCGGFIVHDDLEEALSYANDDLSKYYGSKGIFADYSINQFDVVNGMITFVNESYISAVIKHLSSYHNRYYNALYGVQSSTWIKDHWAKIIENRSDANVELYEHSRWMQPSVVLTFEGESDDTIVIGGHADSISGYFGGGGNKAPGADDNASGIATITEIIRVLVQTSYRPKKTIKFMAYAAEEVGLLGSREIAREYLENNIPVVGVMQLDMTNYKGTSDKDIILISDNTNAEQNAFLGRLIDEYLKVSWQYDRCGYGCSDHASWNGVGFPASFPFEARKNDMNRSIHTSNDTIERSRNGASHATGFAKLGLAYLVELDR